MTRSLPGLILLSVALIVGLGLRPAAAADGDVARMTLEGPGTPYGRVELEAKLRGTTVTVRLTQTFGVPFEPHERIGLATAEDLDTLFQRLRSAGAFDLPPARALPGVTASTRYALELRAGDVVHKFTVEAPEQLSDRRYVDAIRILRTWVTGITGELAFRDGRITPDEAGLLSIDSKPAGRVFLDDVLLSPSTPVDAVRVPAGSHVLRVVSLDGRQTKSFDVTVDKGKTTALRVSLE